MKAHKYWSLGALACMAGCFYTGEYYGSNVPLFRRNGYRQSGVMNRPEYSNLSSMNYLYDVFSLIMLQNSAYGTCL